MTYLTEEELERFGVELSQTFSQLYLPAETSLILYTNNFYNHVDFETDVPERKELFKRALAVQMAYLDKTGVTSVEDRIVATHFNIGRTIVTLSDRTSDFMGGRYNLSADAENLLKLAGFGYSGVSYDR
ncbi:hypothetical protein JDW15_06210 [Aerococcaceae bacterium zg-ZJ1578]|uniref:hypothetical protein n=1 Tax=Aerococcaceae bacterium zg-252 TaxID=2796928 RepID=UPI001A1B640C|nr:hypothetical protein [Aerococcaceae bacterium zg-1578]